MDLVCGLLGFCVALFFIAAIGHLLWVAGEAVFGVQPRPRSVDRCPACAGKLFLGDLRCRNCGFTIVSEHQGTLDEELAATRRQIGRLRRANKISAETLEAVVEAIGDDIREREIGFAPARARAELPPRDVASAIELAATSVNSVVEPGLAAASAAETASRAPTTRAEALVAAAPAPAPVTPAAPPTKPERGFAIRELLSAFMEEKNIRWGELLSGLMIVGSSVGLVISLWATLKRAIPYFPVAVFLLATAALHAAGLYTLRRWRLKSTSRGLLLVSTLLIPLNVLAAMVLNDQKAAFDTIDYAAFAVGLSALASIAFSAARILNRHNPWPLVIAVVGASMGMLPIGRFARPGNEVLPTLRLFALPFVSFSVAAVAHLIWLSAGRQLTTRRVAQSFRFFGIGVFGLVLAGGFLAFKSGDIRDALGLLSPMLAVVAATITGAGLIVHLRLVNPEQNEYRLAGTAVALGGGLLGAAALALAWPRPDLLVAVGLLDAVAFTLLAWYATFPALHLVAALGFSLALLVGSEWALGEITVLGATTELLVTLLTTTRSALILALLALVTNVATWTLARLRTRAQAWAYFASALVNEVIAIAIAMTAVARDLPDQDLATLVFGLAALHWLIASLRINRAYASWFAALLLFVTLAHGLVMNDWLMAFLGARGLAPADPWKLSLLMDATLCLGCAAFARRKQALAAAVGTHSASARWPFTIAAIVASLLAVPLVVDLRHGHFLMHGVYAFWTAAIWFAIACLEGWGGFAVAAQALATLAVAFAVTGFCSRQLWWTGLVSDPRFLNFQFAALAVWSGLWTIVRRLGQRVRGLAPVLVCKPTSVDRIVLGGVAFAFAITCSLAAWPGVVAELSSITTRAGGSPYAMALMIPFGLAALLTAIHVLVRERLSQTFAYAFVTCVLGAILLDAPLRFHLSWPGLPTPYGEGWGAGAWAVLPIAVVAMLAAHWERPNRATLSGLALLLGAVPYLVACRWDASLQTATALRWSMAIAGLVVALAWLFRGGTHPARAHDDSAQGDEQFSDLYFLRDSLIASTGFPLLLLTAQALFDVVAAGRVPLVTADASFALRIAPYLPYVLPLVILAAAFVVYAIADRRLLWGLSATFLIQFTVAFAVAVPLVLAGNLETAAELTRYLQTLGLLAILGTAAWGGIEAVLQRRRAGIGRGAGVEIHRPALQMSTRSQLAFATAIGALLTCGATVGLWLHPEPLSDVVRQCGTGLAWLFLIGLAVVWIWSRRANWPIAAINVGLAFLAAAGVFAAASFAPWNTAGNWLSFHTAMLAWCGVLGLAAVGTFLVRSPNSPVAGAAIADRSLLLLPVILAFAIKAELLDPQRPWWAAGVAIWLSCCVMAIAARAESRARSYVSLVLGVAGAIFIGVRPWLGEASPTSRQPLVELAHITILGVGLHGLCWLAVELRHERRRGRAFDEPSRLQPVHHYGVTIGTFVLALVTLLVFAKRASFPDLSSATPLGWSALLVMCALVAGSLWERDSEHPLPTLYGLGLIAIAIVLDWRRLQTGDLICAAAAAVAGYVLLFGLLWTTRGRLKSFGLRLGMTPFALDRERIVPWLAPTSLALAAIVIGVEFWIVLTFHNPMLRIGGGLATLAVAVGLALLSTTKQQSLVQTAALAVGAIATVQFGWGLMAPIGAVPHEELRRVIRLMAMLGATTFVYGVPLARLVPPTSAWFTSIRRAAIGIAGTTLAALALVLLIEISAFDPTRGAPETLGECLLVASTLGLLAAGLISLAVLPGRDPFFQSERQRFLYVYAAEGVCGLLFAHFFLTNPQFFRHTLQPYWPLLVMAIAYAGTAISELFRRWKITVLAEPLEYSAAFLPVLPVLCFWFIGSELSYSTLLVVIGLLYLFLSLRRGSFVYPAAAAIVGNATLCSLLYEHGISLLVHPQMFVIPPCLTLLAAAQLNRDRLNEKTLASVRYFAMTTIYVSSTGEMFQHGIGTTLWLPMVLAGLSVFGVLAGIVLRVRAFLYLGTSFLLLSIISMVWHAARSIGHVWPWWVFLFTLGVALLTLFGVFEKKRPEVLALVGSLREWER